MTENEYSAMETRLISASQLMRDISDLENFLSRGAIEGPAFINALDKDQPDRYYGERVFQMPMSDLQPVLRDWAERRIGELRTALAAI